MALQYDIIVRFRADMVVESILSQDEVIYSFKTGQPMFGASDDCFHAGLVTDNFAFGNARFMSVFASHFTHSLEYRKANQSNERALSAYLGDKGWAGWLGCSSLKYRIKRMDGHLVPNSQTIIALPDNWGYWNKT
jgi:hypothetical protein